MVININGFGADKNSNLVFENVTKIAADYFISIFLNLPKGKSI